MKIRIYPVKQKVSDWILALISFLEHDQDFESLILEIRNRLDVSEVGINTKNWNEDFKLHFLNSEEPEAIENFKILSNGVQTIIDTYFLPTWWSYSLRIFIVYNILPIYGDTIVTEPSGNHTIKIRFNERVSKTDFIKWVDKNWQLFEWSFPDSRESWKVRIKQNSIPIYERIIELRDVSNLTFSDIADNIGEELRDKFGEDFDSELKINEGSVKQMYSRYKKYLQKFKSPR